MPCLWLYLQPSLQTVSSRFLPPVQLSISTAFNLHPAIKNRYLPKVSGELTNSFLLSSDIHGAQHWKWTHIWCTIHPYDSEGTNSSSQVEWVARACQKPRWAITDCNKQCQANKYQGLQPSVIVVDDIPKSPSSQYGLKAQEDIDQRGIKVTNGPMR
ncbi:uncharacterized protein LOC120708731 isoform X2 [Panicum virgatum]|uniref:uncharacterized protein LOC120708731 isoform X2 n=1 Tax=Panicum virgatum TaxID=38727 RepID=UPI0019D4F88C|nr:uncharacterized protein LOC120708731 isoform X2 [Panicum virgatum]